jgi:DNA-binding transcriptional ArsR family regulator
MPCVPAGFGRLWERAPDTAAPTLNVHLKSLQAAGIVSARRDGRAVLYRRTHLGDQLVAAN